MKGNESYERRKQEKLAIYEKAGLLDKLIQLEPNTSGLNPTLDVSSEGS